MALELAVGIGLRAILGQSSLSSWLEDRVELSTPTSSWKRIGEGIALKKHGLDPYSGDIVHEPPLNILVYELLYNYAPYIFLVADLLSSLLIKLSINAIHRKMVGDEEKELHHSSFKNLAISLDEKLGYYGQLIYLFNPYSIALCATKSTQCTTNLLYSVLLYGIASESLGLVCLAAALATYSSLFPVMLIVPVLMSTSRRRAAGGLALFVGLSAALHLLSFHLTGSFLYLRSVYGFVLTVPDYTPNIGAAWYFFSEMFDHFTVLFLSVYQLNLVLYAVPLSLKFPSNPSLVVFSLLSLLALFKPYTCVGDYVIPLALLPLWAHLFRFLHQFYVVAVATVVLTLLWPVLWYLWVHCLNANSNFYFAVTLAFVLFQSFLLSDILYAEMRREFAKKHGVEPKKIDGVDSVVTLN